MKFWHIALGTFLFAIFLVGAPFEDWFPSTGFWHFLPQLGRGLGEALTIAVFLALTVDVYVKGRLAREIAKDVSPFMASASLPAKLRYEIRDLSVINVYRSEARCEYTITRLVDYPDFVGLTSDISFKVHNVSNDFVPYTHFFAVQKVFKPSGPIKQVLHARASGVLNPDRTNGNYDLMVRDEVEEDLGQDNEQMNRRIWSRDLVLAPKSEAEFAGKTYQILPAEHEEVAVSMIATIGLTIQVRYPENLQVLVTFGHRQGDRTIRRPKERPETWELREALLPFQPAIIEWRQTPTPAVPHEAAERAAPRQAGTPPK